MNTRVCNMQLKQESREEDANLNWEDKTKKDG